MRTLICKECGKSFETSSSRRMYCYDDHYRKCEVCGKMFYVPFQINYHFLSKRAQKNVDEKVYQIITKHILNCII